MFDMMPGVTQSVVGYTGGDNPNPTYQSVCAGDGHSEALQVEFDESKLTYEELLKEFFRMHFPNTNGKKQYRSAIMFHDQEQKEAAERVLQHQQSSKFVNPSELLQPATSWHDAEEYHQKYTEKSMAMFHGD